MEFALANYCVLSVGEAARLEVYSEWPKCREHIHIKRQEALKLVREETHRVVGGANTKVNCKLSMIVPISVGRIWQPVPSSKLMGFRTWGLAPTR